MCNLATSPFSVNGIEPAASRKLKDGITPLNYPKWADTIKHLSKKHLKSTLGNTNKYNANIITYINIQSDTCAKCSMYCAGGATLMTFPCLC